MLFVENDDVIKPLNEFTRLATVQDANRSVADIGRTIHFVRGYCYSIVFLIVVLLYFKYST